MSRKLASIQKVHDIVPIEGADRIELAKVLGWQCVVPKGQFIPGDYCVYFEIDSFLPIRPEFEFLRASSYVDSPILSEGFRIKTRKLKGEISQGLILPLTDFEELDYLMPFDSPVGEDVTELLGVRKFEIEERATSGGTIIGQLPCGVPHTDEIRIQADPELLEDFKGKKYYITTKMDGSSHSLCIDENGFHVCGHNYEYKDDGLSSFYEFVKKRKLKEKMEAYMKKGNSKKNGITSLVVQGEFCAPGIQKNKLKLQAPEWYIFTVIVDGQRVGLRETILATSALGGVMVPFEEIGDDLTAKYPTVDALLARADGTYPNGGAKEGIVIRTTVPEWDKRIDAYLSMKVINNKYLLKEKD